MPAEWPWASWPRLSAIRKTSTFRLAVMFGGAAVLGVLLVLAMVYSLTAGELDTRVDLILRTEMARLLAVPEADLPMAVDAAVQRGTNPLGHVGLISPGGRWVAGDLGASPPLRLGHTYARDDGPDVRGPLHILAQRTPGGAIILVGRDSTIITDLRDHVLAILLASGLVVMPLLLGSGLALSLGPLRRVDRLQQVAGKIAGGRLDARMPIEGRGDELDLLADTVNHMVGEVERSMAQVKSVTDAIAHDLRTPLTRVRNQLYRAARAPDLPEAEGYRIAAAIEDLDTVLARFAALLRISEIEAGHRRKGFAPTRIDELASVVIDLYAPLAEERDVALVAGELAAVSLVCDGQLMVEAMSNLVDNAIKFSPPGGTVTLTVAQRGGEAVIAVVDEGVGIPPEQVDAVVRRFDRGAASPAVPGSGLGLSVVAAVVHLHQFTLDLQPARADPARPGLNACIRAGASSAPLAAM
ncbi:sensor histidine kinase [Novosphingobium pokkalii]|uniref:histidine kinase n=1 Tax=Novosphingobium pokkalii TaxID=1770194 RepID=A0ABV7V2N3_9SPHN|nr:ATP-binding protein [Novosphingobium pokkalii]GHC83139.1 two-component sensor histidine kinase [Novosphingobium pokkalii]